MSKWSVLWLGVVGVLCNSCKSEPPPASLAAETRPEPRIPAAPIVPTLPPVPRGLPEVDVDDEVALTPEKVALGKQMFFDKRLSGNASSSCESCHKHARGWGDGVALSTKSNEQKNTRHAPTLYNVAYHNSWYWDGRGTNLEEVALSAWRSQVGGDPNKVAAFLTDLPAYRTQFLRIFGSPPTAQTIAAALAAFMRTLNSGDAPWDRYEAGDTAAVSEDAVAGFKVFRDKAHCSLCHVPPLFLDLQFHNIGVGADADAKAKAPDPGRYAVTKLAKDMGAFKTPTLRSISKTAPYFHDGSVTSLADAVKLMLNGGKKNKFLDPKLKLVKLTDKEFGQLMAFLLSLESTEAFSSPKLP